ncbi:galectin-3-like [Polyodon spathula]|uniref:galectin-3-like n=1 Tax=Polyodon spathula TaxID=7913 RepID=UPI001B7F5FF6|nr:galectin-3-like [Polyodon spathula]
MSVVELGTNAVVMSPPAAPSCGAPATEFPAAKMGKAERTAAPSEADPAATPDEAEPAATPGEAEPAATPGDAEQ